MVKPKKDRRRRDRQWHLLRMAKRVGLAGKAFPPNLARKVFRQMLRDGGSKCNICGKKGRLVADHCHKRKRHRGRLCHGCNTGLGLFADDPHRLRQAAEYLEMWLEELESQFVEE